MISLFSKSFFDAGSMFGRSKAIHQHLADTFAELHESRRQQWWWRRWQQQRRRQQQRRQQQQVAVADEPFDMIKGLLKRANITVARIRPISQTSYATSNAHKHAAATSRDDGNTVSVSPICISSSTVLKPPAPAVSISASEKYPGPLTRLCDVMPLGVV
jgi:hypothetical protein